jgi:hypothetical protein
MKMPRLSQTRFERTAAALAREFPEYRVIRQPLYVPEYPVREHAIRVLDIPEGLGESVTHRIYEFLDTTLGLVLSDLITAWTENEEASRVLFPPDHPERWPADATLVSPNGTPRTRRSVPRKPAPRRARAARR